MLANTKAIQEVKHRMSGGERRAQIVSTAFDLFAQNGFRGTTTRELAHAVGVSEPVLYQHFSNKRDLYTAIVEHLIEQESHRFEDQLQAVLREEEVRPFLQAFGELVLAWYLEDQRLPRLLMFSALEGHELAQIWHERAMALFFAPVNEKVDRLVEAGQLKKMEPTVLTRSFMSMVAHYGLVTIIFKLPQFELSREETVARFVELFLSGAERR
jgi:TetR/AcrR family transcriptional regulator